MRNTKWIVALIIASLAPAAQAVWIETGYVKFDVRFDNGVAYIYPALPNGSLSWPLGGNCQWSRLQLDNGGDRFGSLENGKRMYGMLLAAKAQGLRASLGYDNADGPACRLAQLYVEWPN